MTQQQALDILKLGHNVYITGPAGSGKTHLLNEYIKYLKGHEDEIGITASTGIAATHMGGTTIHSWTGLGVRDVLNPYDLESLLEKKYLHKRFAKIKVLIIDEVSMLHDFRLDLVNQVLQAFKHNNQPFGGIQVVLCGDFFQLPPVSKSNDAFNQMLEMYSDKKNSFVYNSQSWVDADLKICYLEEQFRQTDSSMTNILNEIRENRVTETSKEALTKTFKEHKKTESTIEPTRLYTHNYNVDEVNNIALNELDGFARQYKMVTRGAPILVANLMKSCLAPEVLMLKKGARVMFVKNNYEKGYVNGTLGEVVSLQTEGKGPVVRISKTGALLEVERDSWTIEEDGDVKAEISQYPLRLAWAITVHKSQGMSLDAVEVDLSRSFEPGMGYVALSRVRTLDGLTLLGLNDKALEINQDVLEFDQTLKEQSEDAVEDLQKISEDDLKKQQAEFLGTFESAVDKKDERESYVISSEMASDGMHIKEIAQKRKMTEETIIGHLEKKIAEDEFFLEEIQHIKKAIPFRHFGAISEAFETMNEQGNEWKLAPVKNYLDKNKKTLRLSPAPSYRDIQLVRMFIKGEQ